jgi:hypothetical protein
MRTDKVLTEDGGEMGDEGLPTAVDALRGGAIGVVSGIKGGAVAGAIAGSLMAVSTTLGAGEWLAVLFALLGGATYGGMGTAVVGAIIGALLGTISGWLLFYHNITPHTIRYLWWGVWAGLGLLSGWLFIAPHSWLAVILAGLCGLLAGWISGRDFAHLLTLQKEEE